MNAAIARGHLLVERIANAPEQGEAEMRKVVKLFDRLSDVLCKVIDAAEVVRCLHPDPAWRQGAETVYEELFSWMNTLNTDPRLYEVRFLIFPGGSCCWISDETNTYFRPLVLRFSGLS